jgi:hypothetical protein
MEKSARVRGALHNASEAFRRIAFRKGDDLVVGSPKPGGSRAGPPKNVARRASE